ncbi:T9SS type A sorting domain-containing protein [Flavobacterium sp. SM2513]|uniref:T9SS type A sorting domain-containing protein n=1 Tax=Flavobacterium sp. SM2513 TaxID=3424766 RepID=UPI003D7FE6F4
MKKQKRSTLVYFLLLFCTIGFAQVHSTDGRKVFGKALESINSTNGLVRCVSSEYEKYLQETVPNRATSEEFEAWLAPKVAAVKAQMRSSNGVTTVITIPVVVHVIHNGDAIGADENISDAQILSQITVLNQDFRRMLNTPGYNSNAIGADIEIEFCMAQRSPAGTATNGIDRVNLGVASWASETSVESTLKATTSWDPTQYFNIWICKFSSSPSADLYGTLGYAQFPSNTGLGGLATNGGSANTDGVVIDYRAFGSSTYAAGSYYTDYDKGRTATHEIGHCFGLIHIWGDTSSCTVNASDSFQDYCLDTPAASDANYDCASVYNSCTVAAGNDMTENYMDYTNDTCMNTFTLDQKARILAVLQYGTRRSSLATSTACQSTLGSETFDKLKGMSVYPNPVNDLLNITIDDSGILPETFTVYNTMGQLVLSKKVQSASDLSIDASLLNSGVYIVRLEKEGAVKTLKFLKK